MSGLVILIIIGLAILLLVLIYCFIDYWASPIMAYFTLKSGKTIKVKLVMIEKNVDSISWVVSRRTKTGIVRCDYDEIAFVRTRKRYRVW